jgi:hypothetical protein
MRLGNRVRSADQHLCGGAAATATATTTTAATSVERRYHPGLRGGLLRAHSRSVCPVGVRRYISLAAAFSWEPMTKGDDALAIYDDDQPCAAPAPSASTGVHVRAVRRDGGEGESRPRLHDRVAWERAAARSRARMAR